MMRMLMTEVLRLFLVEDNDDIALLIRKSLERAGHHVTTCRTAADALIVLGHSSYHLVLLDQRLPDMSGLELLRTMQREGITTPVLMVTGYGDEHLATQVMQAGALDYVVKDPALTFLVDLPKRTHEAVTRHRLKDMNRLLIQAIESARDGILITDLQGRILHVNQALERMTGYDRQEMMEQTPRMFNSGIHPTEIFADMWRTILGRSSWQGELINRRKDGTLLDTSVTISPVVDTRGQMTHFVGICRDISERKQLERQLVQAQKMQSVGTLAGGIAHEFNNLLAGIQGYAALGIREPDLSEPIREFLQFILQLTDRAAHLTRQLLTFARKPNLSRQPVRMERLLKSTAELVRHTLQLDVQLTLPEHPPAESLRALADSNQLQQVLINLALNARDAIKTAQAASPGGTPDVVIFGLRHEELAGELPGFPENVPAGDYVVIEVHDRGTGMSQDVLSQAFDPFYTTKGVGQGTGLGLSVAFGIVRAHQGFLAVDTTPGQGTCVSIYLPRLLAGTGPEGSESFEAAEMLEPENIAGRNIVVIDDEEAVLDVVRRFLEIAGHHVTSFTSGAEALAWLKGSPPVDLVILDLMIPREEGARTVQVLQELRPGLPVLICTGILQSEQVSANLLGQAVGILRKPFRMNELWHEVHQAFKTK